MRILFADLAFALRQLCKHRVYAITAVLSMALGIGATVAVYSVLYGLLIDPYPYHDADRIAAIVLSDRENDSSTMRFTQAQLPDLRAFPPVQSVLLDREQVVTVTGGDLPEPVRMLQMTGNGMEFLQVAPLLGRIFTAAEAPDHVAPPDVAVVSYLYWKSHLGGGADAVGRKLQLNHHPYTVIGIMGPRFTWTDSEVFVPMPADVSPDEKIQTLVRLRDGISYPVAEAQLDSFVHQMALVHPEEIPKGGFRVKLQSLNDWLLAQFKGTLIVLFVAVALLLLIGCGNLSILMLARGTARQQELAMRSALGASRSRIVRQLLAESVLLAFSGGAAGIGFAHAAIQLIVRLIPEYSIPHEVVISLNVPVLLFSLAVSVITGIVAGMSPALAASRPNVAAMIQAGNNRSAIVRGSRIQTLLIGGQIALTVLLLAGAGAAMQNFLEASTAKLGFDSHHVLMMNLQLPEHSYPDWQARMNHYDALLEAVLATPGVKSATFVNGAELPQGSWTQGLQILGTPADKSRKTGVMLVNAEYFSTLGTPLLQGRTMTREEVLRGAHLTLVSRGFVQRFFPDGRNPIGQQVLPSDLSVKRSQVVVDPSGGQPFEIIGVVGDVRNDGMHRPPFQQMYVGVGAALFPGMELMVRTEGDPARLIHAVRESIRSVDGNQTVSQVFVFDDFLSMFAIARERFTSVLFGLFSIIALGLAAIGLVSVMAYTVEQRTREVGVRIALGSTRGAVLSTLLRPALRTTIIGLAIGVFLSAALSNFAYQWTQSSMRNPGVLLGTCGVLLAAVALACILPARRAMQIDPMEALRSN